MRKSELRARRKEQLRNRILEAAEEILHHGGQTQLSMRKLAASIHYSPATIYKYFKSKNQLLATLFRLRYDQVQNTYSRIQQSHFSSAQIKLLHLVLAYVHFALEHPHHYQLWFSSGHWTTCEHGFQIQHTDLTFDAFRIWFDTLDACVHEGSMPFRPTIEHFQILFCQVHGLISMRLQHPEIPWIPLEQQLALTLNGMCTGHPDEP